MNSTRDGRTARWPEGTGRQAVPRRAKATDAIIQGLMADVVSGALPRGDRLPSEKDLAQHFGVSQPTVREAVRVLDAMGLVEVRHGSGVYVTGDTQQFLATSLVTLLQMERVGILDVLEVRGVLGRHSAERAAEHATPADIERIASYAERLNNIDQEPDIQSISNAVVGFQLAVSAATHNALLYALEAFLVKLSMQFQLAAKTKKGTAFWRKWSGGLNADRNRLLEAVRKGEVEGAVAAWDGYLADQHELFAGDRELAKIRLSDTKYADMLSLAWVDTLSTAGCTSRR
jgi:GntR family transcriptional regulator, transcriptional repressor for pyruvate dehydrogenase complex